MSDIAHKLTELSHIQPARILFVSGEARRGSRATVKPLGGKTRPKVSLQGKRALYCITLRPKFFRTSTPEERVATLLHELLHISPKFDGTLSPERRHALLPGVKFSALIEPLLQRYLATADPLLLEGMSHDGEVIARQWLERPTGKAAQRDYSEADLFFGPVEMITKRKKVH